VHSWPVAAHDIAGQANKTRRMHTAAGTTELARAATNFEPIQFDLADQCHECIDKLIQCHVM